VVLKEGDFVSLNGVTGEVIKGAQPVKKPALTGDLGTFMKWVDAKRRLRVLTNAGERSGWPSRCPEATASSL
jgi:pyruvate,orthophosphate dikinase